MCHGLWQMLSKHRLRRFRQSIMSDEAGIIVKTGEDLVGEGGAR